ncbi:MAG: hypothetical protein ACKVU4_12565 [Phycisphaerales bacterium]
MSPAVRKRSCGAVRGRRGVHGEKEASPLRTEENHLRSEIVTFSNPLPLSILGVGILGLLLPAMRDRDEDPIPLKVAKLRIELNATAGDVGIQADIDGEPWERLIIEAPNGKKILDVRAKGKLESLGMTELFFESHEPSFDEVPLEDVLAMFPEGTYEFCATGTDGVEMEGEAIFTHMMPDAAVVLSPVDGSTQDPANMVVDWEPVTGPPGIEIVEYEVLVVQISPKRVLSAHVPASITSLTVPPEFLVAGQSYQFEVLAIEAGGNQTITEGVFFTP